MKNDILFTVFTPTYNRKELLPRVYNCLQQQTYRNFEWVIIDDGSTDGTEEQVRHWQKEADFEIVYQWQPNKGKHFAYNAVMKIARGELFTSIDSDDEVTPDNLERLKYHWDKFTDEDKRTIGGISFLCVDQHGQLVGDKFPKDFQVMDLMGMYFINKVQGEKGGMMQTKAFAMYPFPEHIKNVVVPESSFMYQVARDWKMCFINEALRIYWLEDRTDSLSLLSKKPKNYPGSHYGHLCFLNNNMRFFTRRPKLCIGEATRYAKLSFHLNIGIAKQLAAIKPFSAKILWACCLPLGYVLYKKEKQAK